MSAIKIPLGRFGELHLDGALNRAWENTIFERPVICTLAIGRAMVGFTASRVWGSPLIEFYFGWPCAEIYWERHPEDWQ